MSRHEFMPVVKMWLGIHLSSNLPQSLRSVCGQIIDQFGDHLLGCAHCPLRIKRHDALRDIIWHALLMDNKGAVWGNTAVQTITGEAMFITLFLCLVGLPILMCPCGATYNPNTWPEQLFKQSWPENQGRLRRTVFTKKMSPQQEAYFFYSSSHWVCGLQPYPASPLDHRINGIPRGLTVRNLLQQ